MADFTQSFLGGVQQGQQRLRLQQEEEQRTEENRLKKMMLKHQMDRLKIEDEVRARKTAFEEAGQQKEFDAPAQMSGSGAVAPTGGPMPRVDIQAQAPASVPVQIPGITGGPGPMTVQAPTRTGDAAIKANAERSAVLTRLQTTQDFNNANPDLYTPSFSEATLVGLPEYANKKIPASEWKTVVMAKERERDNTRADRRDANAFARGEAAATRAEERVRGTRVKNLQTQWKNVPGVAEAAKGEMLYRITDAVGDIYNQRRAAGQPVGEAEEIALIGRLRTIEPDSVVREGEFLRLQGMAPLADRLLNLFARLKQGGTVPPGTIQQALETAREVRNVREQWLAEAARPLINQAIALDVPLDQLSFGKYAAPPAAFTPPPAAANPATQPASRFKIEVEG